MSNYVTIKQTIELTPEIMAKVFWEFDSNAQAVFFQNLARLAGDSLEAQMHYARKRCNDDGKKAMQIIGVEREDNALAKLDRVTP